MILLQATTETGSELEFQITIVIGLVLFSLVIVGFMIKFILMIYKQRKKDNLYEKRNNGKASSHGRF